MPGPLRVAVCFFGLTRSLEYTLERLRAQLLDPLLLAGAQLTTFGHTYSVSVAENNRTMEHNASFNWKLGRLLVPEASHFAVENREEVLAAGLEANLSRWYDLVGLSPLWVWGDKSIVRNHVLQLHSLSAVTALWWPHLASSFDVVIYSRFDVLYVTPLPMAVVSEAASQKNAVYVPDWASWGGVNDRFCVASPAAAAAYGLRLRNMQAFVAEKNGMHSETFLAYSLKRDGFEAYKKKGIVFALCRADGGFQSGGGPLTSDGLVTLDGYHLVRCRSTGLLALVEKQSTTIQGCPVLPPSTS